MIVVKTYGCRVLVRVKVTALRFDEQITNAIDEATTSRQASVILPGLGLWTVL